MFPKLYDVVRRQRWSGLKRAALFTRGLLFLGLKYQCPCCGWNLRSFTDKGRFLTTTADGYCPRCNAKARHRRDWLFLREQTPICSNDLIVLEVAPWSAMGRLFSRMSNIQYTGMDINPQAAHVSVGGNLQTMPFAASSFDAVICIHVLEHVDDDRAAMQEIYRVMKPGAWALITVPILECEPTREDDSITSPAERERLFGEPNHVRFYGTDFQDRLEAAGLKVDVDKATNITNERRRKYGLRPDENIFFCRKTS